MSEQWTESELWPESELRPVLGKLKRSEEAWIYPQTIQRQLSEIIAEYFREAHMLESHRKDVYSEVQTLRSEMEGLKEIVSSFVGRFNSRRTDREAAVALFSEMFSKLAPRESSLNIVKTRPSELRAFLVVPDSDYVKARDAAMDLLAEIHRRYDLKTEVIVFRKSEVEYIPGSEFEKVIHY